MKITRIALIAALCFSFVFSSRCFADDERNPILDFVGSYLMGKAAETVWDSVTGKPDTNELQQRIYRLEKLLGDSAGPIQQLHSQINSTTTESQFHKEAKTALDSLKVALSQNPQALSHIYVGSVGRLKAVFALNWENGNKVSGVYCNPTRDATRIYELTGTNSSDGVINLNEYTDGVVSARLALSKQINPAWIIWNGKMYNTDGRILDVTFQRERK